jgi:hypothetical protein
METPQKSRRRRGGEYERVLTERPSCASKEVLVAPDSAVDVEDWLLMGAKGGTNNSSALLSTTKSSPRGRGRSPRRPIESPELWTTPEQQRKSRSHEPKRSPPTCCLHSSPQKPSSDATGFRGVGTPIPADYIEIIVSAFGAHADLYTDVLEMEHKDTVPAKLRVAYFRRGRKVLQMQQQSLTSPVSIADAGEEPVSPKKKFRAVTKAYEILTNPGWKAYYEAYGLVVEDESTASDFPENQELVEDIESITDEGSISILRRSNSWGPTRSRSTSRGRVYWKEEVEELVYHPDPVNASVETESLSEYMETFQSLDDDQGTVEVSIEDYEQRSVRQEQQQNVAKKKTKHRLVIDTPGLNEDLEKLDKNFKRDFLDDFEASLDGLEAKLGNFVRYALSDTEDDATGTTDDKKQNQRQRGGQKEDYSGDDDGVKPSESCDSSLHARQLFTNLTKPYPLIDKRSALASQDNNVVTTAPLKKGKVDQLRTKPKKTANRKKKVDKVPTSAFGPFGKSASNSKRDAGSSPCMGLSVTDAVEVMTDFWNVGGNAQTTTSQAAESVSSVSAATSRVSSERSVSSASNVTDCESLGDYRQGEDASTRSSSESEMKLKGTGFNVASSQALSCGDALTMTIDDATKGFMRMERDTAGEHSVASPTSDGTASKDNRLRGMMSSLAKQAKETIRKVATVQETEPILTSLPAATTTTQSTSDCDQAASSGSSDDANFLAALNGYCMMLVDDMSKLGSRISTNLGEANRAVVETMAFPVDEVDGMLSVLESELNFPDNSSKESILKAFTF